MFMSDTLKENEGMVSTRGRITNLRFADAISALAVKEQELETAMMSHCKKSQKGRPSL